MRGRDKERKKRLRRMIRELVRNDYCYDILTALRGPDSDTFQSQRLKTLTTGRIRGVVGVLYWGCVKTMPLTEEEMKERDLLLDSKEHFANHYFAAVDAICELYGYDLRIEAKIK